METIQKDITISSIEKDMIKSCIGEGRNNTKRKCGEVTPFKTQDEKVYHGFLSDWDGDCRVKFYLSLIKSGFKTKKYEAEYYWTVENDTHEVSYVEGDVYVTFKE